MRIDEDTRKNERIFSLKCNGIPLQVTIPNHEFKQDFEKVVPIINGQLRNSMRCIKYFGRLHNNMSKEELGKKMNSLVASDTGEGIRVDDDMLPEWTPFYNDLK